MYVRRPFQLDLYLLPAVPTTSLAHLTLLETDFEHSDLTTPHSGEYLLYCTHRLTKGRKDDLVVMTWYVSYSSWHDVSMHVLSYDHAMAIILRRSLGPSRRPEGWWWAVGSRGPSGDTAFPLIQEVWVSGLWSSPSELWALLTSLGWSVGSLLTWSVDRNL